MIFSDEAINPLEKRRSGCCVRDTVFYIFERLQELER